MLWKVLSSFVSFYVVANSPSACNNGVKWDCYLRQRRQRVISRVVAWCRGQYLSIDVFCRGDLTAGFQLRGLLHGQGRVELSGGCHAAIVVGKSGLGNGNLLSMLLRG